MTENFLSIPVSILILLASYECGRILFRLFKFENSILSGFEKLVLTFAVGYVAYQFIVTALGYFLFLSGEIVTLITTGLAISGVTIGRKILISSFREAGLEITELNRTPLNRLLFSILSLTLLMDFVLTLVPTTAWDTLTYHYTLPMIWLKNHGLIPYDKICYDQLPMASEMMFLSAFAIGGIEYNGQGIGHLAANHITWFTGAISVLALVEIGKRIGNLENSGFADKYSPGLLGSIALMSLPIMHVEEMEGGYIENFFNFIALAIFIALLNYKETKKQKHFYLIGILSGGLLAIKHTGIIIDTIVLVTLIVWMIREKEKNEVWLALILSILVALIPPSLWYLKSYINTGDPVYPFLMKFISPETPVPDIMYWSNPSITKSFVGFLTYIPRLSYDTSLTQFEFRLLSWYYLPLLPFFLYFALRASENKYRVIGLFTGFMILAIYLLAPGEPRYFLVAWGLFAVIGSCGLFSLTNKGSLWKYIIPILILVPISFSMIERTREMNRRIPTILGLATIDDYFQKSLDIYPIYEYLNTNTDKLEGVIMVEPRVFYLERNYEIWYPYPTRSTKYWNGMQDEQLVEYWMGSGYKYLAITWGPNYRAIALDYMLSGYDNESKSETLLHMPPIQYVRASYAEKALQNKKFESDIDENRFDLQSIRKIKSLIESELLVPVFNDPEIGVIFELKRH